MELGMGFAFMFTMVMVVTGLWPVSLFYTNWHNAEEDLLLNYMCVKWEVDEKLPTMTKLLIIRKALVDAIQTKKSLD